MHTSTWVLIGVIIVLLVIIVRLLSSLSIMESRGIRFRDECYEMEQRARDAESEAWQMRNKYEQLLVEYNELDELEDAEDYVRKSLGYPPDEDEEESA